MKIEKAYIEQPQSHNPGPEVIADVCTTQHTGQRLLTEVINYWLPESLVFAHAMACVEIVSRSDKANAIYREIVQACGLPGCQNIFEASLPYSPNLAELFIESIRANKTRDKASTMRAPAQAKTPPNASVNDQSDTRNAQSDTRNDLCSDLKLWSQSDEFKQMSEHRDYQHLVKRINEFILVGFNRKIDQDNKEWKVTPETPPYLLAVAISLRSLAEYENIQPQNLIEFKVQVDDKLYNFDYKTPRNPSTRKERSIRSGLTKAFKHDGFVLRHDKKLRKDAGQWYKCRVNPGTIEVYLNEKSQDGIILERSNVETALAPYDEATGYPRKWRK